MKRCVLVVVVSALAAVCSTARADVYSVTPPDPDLDDLDHCKAYTWGIDTPWPAAQEHAVGATLSFRQIRDWQWETNVLYIHLLDDAPAGIRYAWDNQASDDYFEGEGIVLTVYRDLPATAQDLSYEFTKDQVDALNGYAADGRFGLGFDPDCHFYNCGVKLDIVTELGEVPEPATAGLLAVGMVAVLLRRRRRRA